MKTTLATVTVEPEGPTDATGHAESWEVILWDPEQRGATLGSFSTQWEADTAADLVRSTIDAWRTKQFIVTFEDRRQLGFMDGEVHLRESPGSCWEAPLSQSNRPHEPNTAYVGKW